MMQGGPTHNNSAPQDDEQMDKKTENSGTVETKQENNPVGNTEEKEAALTKEE